MIEQKEKKTYTQPNPRSIKIQITESTRKQYFLSLIKEVLEENGSFNLRSV